MLGMGRKKNILSVLLIISLVLMLLAPAAMARPVEKQTMLVGFNDFPGPAEMQLLRSHGATVTQEFTLIPTVVVELPANSRAIQALERNPVIDYIEPDVPFFPTGTSDSWGIDRIMAPEVWTETTGNGVKVAILDTGIATHPNLKVYGGTNTIDGNDNYSDTNGHGTHVAGTVAALNSGMVVGTAPAAKLYAVKVLGDNGGTASSVALGIDWAVANGMQIINMSLGGSSHSDTLLNACNAAEAAGLLLVSSAGNSGNRRGIGDNVSYPAAYESVIAVAATGKNDKRASFSSTGPAVEISAPGVDIISTYLNGQYAIGSGTSMASPHVAGVAALVWAQDITLSNAELRSLLQNTAEDLGMPANHQGYGLVRADWAVAATSSEPQPDLSVSVSASPDVFEVGSVVTSQLTVTVQNPDDSVVSGLSSGNFETFINGNKVTADFNSTDEVGTYFANLDVQNWSPGGYEVKVTVTSGVSSGTGTATITVTGEEQENTGTVSVTSISYATNGGRNNDRHLTVTASLEDYKDNPVAGASVTIALYRNGSPYATATGTTGTNGSVSFTENNAPAGTYTTTVTAVDAGSLEWDGVTPTNSFIK